MTTLETVTTNQMSGRRTEGAVSTTVRHAGVALRRKVESGPRGGRHYIYQAAEADPVWGYWYDSAAQAARDSNASDRVVARGTV